MIHSIKKFIRSKKNSIYQNELIDKLSNEHQKLFKIVEKMDKAIEKENKKNIKKLISSFKKELELHILYEDTNLYEHLYLRYYYYDDIRDEIEKKHNQMKKIAQAVEEFIDSHMQLDNFEQFIKDFKVIKDVMLKRVEFEEEVLYDLYDRIYSSDVVLYKLKYNK
jgi:predicted oxidoreductase (fatty acid repression mutant protein)